MITLGIPTLNRYDLLEQAIKSAERGSMRPDRYLIVDNGNRFSTTGFYHSLGDRLQVISHPYNVGVARGWNEIINNSEDIRIISNDDVLFFEDTIEIMVNHFNPDQVLFPAGVPAANAFSCFLIPTNVVNVVGLFDERLSPNYAYFEDNDYHRRMILRGKVLQGIPSCRLEHTPSSTLQNLTDGESRMHHVKFKEAHDRYVKKWGGEPGHERLETPAW